MDRRRDKAADQRAGQGAERRGRRSVPHTADLRIEAWGGTREECLAETVRGLVESFADVSGAGCQQAAERHLTGDTDADLVAAAVEEVIYCLDADDVVPAAVEVHHADDGGIDLTLWVVGASTVEITGAAPKAASLSGLRCAPDEAGVWRSAVTVDV